uniref:Bacterioferritin n=1 Tax=Prevotella sp. GTC17254 TaxID=3236794 RepID=A0AB33J2K2_9BACT
MTKNEAIAKLAELAAVWYGNSKQHAVFAAYNKFNGYNKLAEKFAEEASEEFAEANEAINRLIELGCQPTDLATAIKTVEFDLSADPKEQLELDLKYGTDDSAIQELSLLSQAFADDYITQELIQKWIKGEKEHIDWNRQHRQLIEKVGYDNYLLEML